MEEDNLDKEEQNKKESFIGEEEEKQMKERLKTLGYID